MLGAMHSAAHADATSAQPSLTVSPTTPYNRPGDGWEAEGFDSGVDEPFVY